MWRSVKVLGYKVGTEIETSIKVRDCSDCDYCSVCDSCPTCQECNLCEVCNGRLRERYDMSCEEIQDRGWCTDVCEFCNPCDGCLYVRNPDYCPYTDDYYYLPAEFLEKYFMETYEDGSCGMEYPTKPFSSLTDYYYVLTEFAELIGREYMSPYDRCGGHVNISFTNWEHYKSRIYNNTVYFLDLLTFMFLSRDSYRRSGYHFFPDGFSDCTEKYSAIHFKNYAVEYRFPDSPYDATNHLLVTAVLLGLSMLKTKIRYSPKEKIRTKGLYLKFKDSEFDIKSKDKVYLARKFKKMHHYVKPYLKAFSQELSLDLNGMLKFRFQNPVHDSDFLLDDIVNKFNL